MPLYDDNKWFEYLVLDAFLQDGGIVNDDMMRCSRYRELMKSGVSKHK